MSPPYQPSLKSWSVAPLEAQCEYLALNTAGAEREKEKAAGEQRENAGAARLSPSFTRCPSPLKLFRDIGSMRATQIACQPRVVS